MNTDGVVSLEPNPERVSETSAPPAAPAPTTQPQRRGLASAQVCPGSRTCIVVGSLDDVEGLDLGVYPNVMWFSRDRAMPARFRIDRRKLLIVPPGSVDLPRLSSALTQFIELDAIRLPSIFLTDEIVGESAPVYLNTIETIFAQCEMHHRGREFREQLGFIYQRNVLANLSAYVRHRVPRTWAGALKGVPAFICGAGPSLDASAAKLAECAPHGVVFAADSAVRALSKRGITVDFSVTVDSRKSPENCLPPGTRLPDRVILANSAPPAWIEAMPPERVYFLSSCQLTEDELEKFGFRQTAIETKENCGITAFELAVHLGCQPIYLFGMDHAVDTKDPTRRHTLDLATNLQEEHKKNLKETKNRNYAKVPGNYQDEIATALFHEWSYLDKRCTFLPAGLVHNVIDRGARFRNTTIVHPDAFAVDPAWSGKAARLAQLAVAEPIDERAWERLREVFTRLARKAEKTIADAQLELGRGRKRRGFEILFDLFRDTQFHVLFGNYFLRIRPPLLHSAEVHSSLWPRLFDECRVLCALAKNLR